MSDDSSDSPILKLSISIPRADYLAILDEAYFDPGAAEYLAAGCPILWRLVLDLLFLPPARRDIDPVQFTYLIYPQAFEYMLLYEVYQDPYCGYLVDFCPHLWGLIVELHLQSLPEPKQTETRLAFLAVLAEED